MTCDNRRFAQLTIDEEQHGQNESHERDDEQNTSANVPDHRRYCNVTYEMESFREPPLPDTAPQQPGFFSASSLGVYDNKDRYSHGETSARHYRGRGGFEDLVDLAGVFFGHAHGRRSPFHGMLLSDFLRDDIIDDLLDVVRSSCIIGHRFAHAARTRERGRG